MSTYLQCPACGEKAEHEILRDREELLVRCPHCGHVYRTPSEQGSPVIACKAIVSREKESKVCTVELLKGEDCATGDLLVAICDGEPVGAEVTGIEVGERRVERAIAGEITTLWMRRIEDVLVYASVHDGRITIPLAERLPGEEDIEVGREYRWGQVRFRVDRIKLRSGSLIRKAGWKAYARKIKRVYGTKL
ncbi:MAG: HVO_0476 family zinc finger protein [Methanomicrobiaceae archaeon]|nr:HVO_0476 family zinc finger protein [Methanomicrobiaceae archaeon]